MTNSEIVVFSSRWHLMRFYMLIVIRTPDLQKCQKKTKNKMVWFFKALERKAKN